MAKKYKENFLKQVFVRIDFQKPLENYEKGLNPSFENALRQTFPTIVEHKIKQQSIEKALAQLSQQVDAEEVMNRLANDLTNKLLHKPTLEMRKALKAGDEERVRLLKHLISP